MTLRKKSNSRSGYPKKLKPKVAFIHTIPITSLMLYFPLPERLKQKGYEVLFCFAPGKEANLIRNIGYEVKTLPLSRNPFSPGNLIAAIMLIHYLRSRRVDIVETSTPVASVIGRIAATLAGVPIRINTVRGTFPKETHPWKYRLFIIAERLLHRTSTFTITINEKDKQEFLKKGFATTDKIINIGCGGMGVDFNKFNRLVYEKEIMERRSNLGIKSGDYVVAFIGRLTREKGIDDFLKVVCILLKKGLNVKGLVIGDVLKGEHQGISIDHIKAYLVDQGIEDKVMLLGFRSDVANLLSVSDVLVMPTRREGFGMVIAEAAAMGKPTVAYSCRGTKEAIDDGVTGILVENGDVQALACAVGELLEDEGRRKALGEAAFLRAKERYDQAVVLNKYLNIFDMLLSRCIGCCRGRNEQGF